GNPHQRRLGCRGDGRDGAQHAVFMVAAMLHVERDGVHDRRGQRLDGQRIGQRRPGGEDGVAGGKPCGETRRNHAFLTCSIAWSSNSSMVRRIWWSDWATPAASKSARSLRNTSWSPASSKSAATTAFA